MLCPGFSLFLLNLSNITVYWPTLSTPSSTEFCPWRLHSHLSGWKKSLPLGFSGPLYRCSACTNFLKDWDNSLILPVFPLTFLSLPCTEQTYNKCSLKGWSQRQKEKLESITGSLESFGSHLPLKLSSQSAHTSVQRFCVLWCNIFFCCFLKIFSFPALFILLTNEFQIMQFHVNRWTRI